MLNKKNIYILLFLFLLIIFFSFYDQFLISDMINNETLCEKSKDSDQRQPKGLLKLIKSLIKEPPGVQKPPIVLDQEPLGVLDQKETNGLQVFKKLIKEQPTESQLFLIGITLLFCYGIGFNIVSFIEWFYVWFFLPPEEDN